GQSQSDTGPGGAPSSRRERPPVKPGKKVPLFLRVVNGSDFPVRDVPVRVETLTGVSTDLVDFYEKKLNLDPREERTLKISPRARGRLTVFRATAGKPDPLRRRILPLFIPDGGKPATRSGSLFSHPDLVRCQWDAYDPTVRATVTVPVYHTGIPEREVYYASLLDEAGKTVSEARLIATEDSVPFGEKDLRFRLRVSKEDLRPVYRLRVAPTTASPSTEAAAGQAEAPRALLEMDVVPGPPQLPDLALDPNSIEFSPDRPMEGESVFMRVRIENKGNVPSGPFRLRLSATRWGRVQQLLSPRPYIPQLNQESLDPGEDRTIALRWDYSAYATHAGDQTIRLEIDPSQTIAEIDEGNNSAESVVRIFTRPKPKVTAVDTRFETLPDGKRRVDVRVTVKNLGESAAQNYYLGIFRKQPPTLPDYQNPEYLVREVPLPPLAENEEASFSHQWEIEGRSDPTPTDEDTSPTAVVYRPTRTIRSKLREGSQAVQEW
ncbi:MAG TPA: CARDB domain-containing protein, partial [Sumerlaeia bacterium]|nr:CARDB domain-containing protein [Sumerlaeia bacterium]